MYRAKVDAQGNAIPNEGEIVTVFRPLIIPPLGELVVKLAFISKDESHRHMERNYNQ